MLLVIEKPRLNFNSISTYCGLVVKMLVANARNCMFNFIKGKTNIF